MKKMLKKSEVLKEGYVKGLKEAQRIIEAMVQKYEDGYGPEGPLPDHEEVFADDEWNAIYAVECKHGHKIKSFEKIEYGEDDGEVIATIDGIVWGEPLH